MKEIYDLGLMKGKRFENVIIQDTKRTLLLNRDMIKVYNPDFKVDNLHKIIVSYISHLELLIDIVPEDVKRKLVNLIDDQLLYCLCKKEWINLNNHIKESLNV